MVDINDKDEHLFVRDEHVIRGTQPRAIQATLFPQGKSVVLAA
jgi:hypothetical protein